MGRQRAAGGGAGGGEIVQAARRARARVATAFAALALTAALAAWPAFGDVRPAVAWIAGAAGVAALLLLAGSLAVGWAAGVSAAVAVVGADYGVSLALDDAPLDLRAPVVAAGLLVLAELGHWSLELRAAVTPEPGTHLRRLAFLCGLALATLTVGGGLVAVVDVAGGGGLELAGALAAAAALGFVTVLGRRTV